MFTQLFSAFHQLLSWTGPPPRKFTIPAEAIPVGPFYNSGQPYMYVWQENNRLKFTLRNAPRVVISLDSKLIPFLRNALNKLDQKE